MALPGQQPSVPELRQQQWERAIALLENQIKFLAHEPDIAFDLEALWVMLVRLREQEQVGVSP